jgi:hypothetical protein
MNCPVSRECLSCPTIPVSYPVTPKVCIQGGTVGQDTYSVHYEAVSPSRAFRASVPLESEKRKRADENTRGE